MKRNLLVYACFIFSLYAYSQDDMKTGIIYGKDHAYSLSAPDGWILDNKSGVRQGLYAVFYKKGSSWQNAETVMYTNTASLEKQPHKSIDELIKYDTDNFKMHYNDIEIRDGNKIDLNNKNSASVKYLSGKSYGNFEAIAYIDAGKTGIMIVMSSRSKDGFQESLTAFESLVKSYLYIGDKVTVDKK